MDKDGWTAAHYVARRDSALPILQLLIAAAPQGSSQAAQDVYGWRPVHLAAAHNCPATLRCLFDSAPAAEQALATLLDGRMALHLAAESGAVAAAELLLAVAPEACLMRSSVGETPLSVAAHYGQEGMAALLLAAAPQATLVAESSGDLPIHTAAWLGHAAVVAQLLAACPESAMASGEDNLTPLAVALRHCQVADKRDAVVRVLLPAMPANLALETLKQEGLAGQRLLLDFVAARLPLSDDLWARLPNPCLGLGRLLPAALAHGTGQARHLVRHLPAADVELLRLAALCLARAQRRTRVRLPPSVTGLILSLFDV